MQSPIEILPLEPDSESLDALAAEARRLGYGFVDRLIDDARTGKNRFTQKGECFLGIFKDGTLVGCGGVNKDPYTNQPVARLRHIYVLSGARRRGLASMLVRELVRQSEIEFSVFRLRTSDKNADAFYDALGFDRTNDEYATHVMHI